MTASGHPYRAPIRQASSLTVLSVPFNWRQAASYALIGALFVWFLAGETNDPKFARYVLGVAVYGVFFGVAAFPVVRYRAYRIGREVVVEGARFPYLSKTIVSSPIEEVDRFVAVSTNEQSWFLALLSTKKEAFSLTTASWNVNAARLARVESTLNRWLDEQKS